MAKDYSRILKTYRRARKPSVSGDQGDFQVGLRGSLFAVHSLQFAVVQLVVLILERFDKLYSVRSPTAWRGAATNRCETHREFVLVTRNG